jgi:hypothetical protein
VIVSQFAFASRSVHPPLAVGRSSALAAGRLRHWRRRRRAPQRHEGGDTVLGTSADHADAAHAMPGGRRARQTPWMGKSALASASSDATWTAVPLGGVEARVVSDDGRDAVADRVVG